VTILPTRDHDCCSAWHFPGSALAPATVARSALANLRCMYHPSVLLHNPSMKMDRASQALAQGLPASVPRSFRAIADHTDVPRSTLHARARGRRSIEAKAQSQQYLTPFEEKAMVDFVLQMSDLGTPVRI
jgi:hypothetical protein